MGTFEQLLAKHGEHILWSKMRKLKSFRDYYQKWPYDDCLTVQYQNLDNYIDFDAVDPYEAVLAECNELVDILTPKEREIAELVVKGYKPRDIAKLLGHSTSGRVRWHKFNIKQKLEAVL